MALLSVSGVTKHFGGNVVLDGIDMELDPGRLYNLIGSNGSGKTTLINVISGMLRPDDGKIVFDGIDVTAKGLYDTFDTGLVRTWQTPQPFVTLSTLENFVISSGGNPGESFLKAPLKSTWKKDEQRITDKALEIMEIINLIKRKDIPSQNLSGGQQKLLELGRAMMSGAKMILMDEPIAGVNPTLAHEIFERIVKICKKDNITFLIIEHRLDIALQYMDHVFALNRGKIIAEGEADDVINHPEVIESYLGG